MHNMWCPEDEQRLCSTLRCFLVILDDSVDTTLEELVFIHAFPFGIRSGLVTFGAPNTILEFVSWPAELLWDAGVIIPEVNCPSSRLQAEATVARRRCVASFAICKSPVILQILGNREYTYQVDSMQVNAMR